MGTVLGEGRGKKVKSYCCITKLKYPWVVFIFTSLSSYFYIHQDHGFKFRLDNFDFPIRKQYLGT